MILLKAEDDGDVEEVEKTQKSSEIRCISASLYEDTNDVLRLPFDEDSEVEVTNVLAFLLTAFGGLHVRSVRLYSRSLLTGLRYIVYRTWTSRYTLQTGSALSRPSLRQISWSDGRMPGNR